MLFFVPGGKLSPPSVFGVVGGFAVGGVDASFVTGFVARVVVVMDGAVANVEGVVGRVEGVVIIVVVLRGGTNVDFVVDCVDRGTWVVGFGEGLCVGGKVLCVGGKVLCAGAFVVVDLWWSPVNKRCNNKISI